MVENIENIKDAKGRSAYYSETALSVVSDWTPWAVAAAPALAIGTALYNHDSSWLIIISVALAVELGGVLAGHTLTEVREYNEFTDEHTRRSERPLWLALGIYAAIGCVLSVLLDVFPELRHWWPVALPLLAVVVYWVNGERLVIRRLRQDIASTQSETQSNSDATAETLRAIAARLDALATLPSRLAVLDQSIASALDTIVAVRDRVAALEAERATPATPIALAPMPTAKARVFEMLDSAGGDVGNQVIAEQTGVSLSSIRAYRAQWLKERTVEAEPSPVIPNGNGHHAERAA